MLAKTTLVLMLRQGTMAEDFEEFVLGVAPNGPQAQKIKAEIEAELSRVRKATGAAWVGVGPDGTFHLPRKESVQTALHKYGLADRFIYPDAKIEVDEVLLFGDLAALDAVPGDALVTP